MKSHLKQTYYLRIDINDDLQPEVYFLLRPRIIEVKGFWKNNDNNVILKFGSLNDGDYPGMKAFISYDEKNRIKTSPELTASSHRSTEYHIATENLSESEILEGLKLGKDPVLAHVYNLYVEDLFRFGFQYTPSEEIIADSIHDVFLVLITKKQLLENIQSLKAYLFTALSRQIIHSLKRRKLLDQKVAEMEAFKISFQVESRMITEEIHQERLLKVKDAITKLSKKQRQAILLYYSDGFTHQEIAMIMGFRHTNSAAKLIARGIREIRKYVTSTTILVMFTLMKELLNSS